VEDRIAAYDDNPRHRRAQLVRITPRGRRALRKIQAAQHVWADALGAKIGGSDLQRAGAVLDRVYRALGEPTA
jgi:DNA-binding MarR family transcriptional regulator